MNLLNESNNESNWYYCNICIVRTDHDSQGNCLNPQHKHQEQVYLQHFGIANTSSAQKGVQDHGSR